MSKYKTTWTELRQHMSEMELAYVVRYLDPKNGKRFAVPFKTQPDANKKRDQLKRDGAQQLSITKDYLKGKFKEDVSKDSAYAIGMAKAKDMYNDEPPVDKKTVTKAHDIAKAILRKEEFITEEQLIEQDKQDIQEFSRSQLDALARQYSDLKGKTISIDNANKLRKIFDKIPNHFLNDLRKKHIPFLSGLALSRMVQKGIPVKEDREIAEGVEVQITLKGSGPINKRSHVHDFKNRADAEKWIKWYKTGGSSSALMPFEKNKVDKIEIHETAVPADYLKSKLNTHQINNIKNTWKSKKASDVTPGVKAMIKKMDIPTQLAIKQANIPHLSKLIEVNELCQVGDKVKKEETMLEFTTQQIKQAYGILNDPRYKQGNYSGAVKAIEKLAKGLSKHKDVANALKRANESVIVDPKAKKETNIHNKKSFEKLRNETKLVRLGDKGKTATGQKAAVIDLEPRAIPV